MEGTPTAHQEIETNPHFSIEMENNTSTNQEIEREGDGDLIQNELKDDLRCTSIAVMLQTLPSLSEAECCIYRVPRKLRNINEEFYTPQVVSIGPFHHGEEHLQNMEEYKLRHLHAFLVRTGKSLEYYLQIVKKWEKRVRLCYAETIKLKSDEFVNMILVDGSFIVEFLLRAKEGRHIFHQKWVLNIMYRDMALLENQLPLFVLDGLFKTIPEEIIMSLMPDHKENLSFATRLFNRYQNIYKLPAINYSPEIKHFVDFIWTSYRSSFLKVEPQGNTQYGFLHNVKKHFFTFIRRCYLLLFPQVHRERHTRHGPPPSVIELHQAGVKFKKRTSNDSLFDIKFANGILEIPQLTINEATGSWFQNLIAFEQCHSVPEIIITDYFALLDGMINTSKDVDLLIQDEIIVNRLASSDEVSTLFNNSSKEVFLSYLYNSFSSLCQDLNAYCKSPRHKWMATLRREYFSTPWATVSVIAAVVLLVLTFIQTICSILSL